MEGARSSGDWSLCATLVYCWLNLKARYLTRNSRIPSRHRPCLHDILLHQLPILWPNQHHYIFQRHGQGFHLLCLPQTCPPFASTVPKGLKPPPSYASSPQGSPTEVPAIVLTRPPISSSQRLPTIVSLPSSLDDFVPSLPPTPPAHQRTSTQKRPSLESLPALNPTSSRFTSLGRAKVPLNRVLGLRDSKKEEGLCQCVLMIVLIF